MSIPLTKYISSSSHCSRREAEKLIRAGKVLVNGARAELGATVEEVDNVKIGNKIIKPIEEKIYIKLNKPVGYTCTNRRFKGEKNIFELVDSDTKGMFVVGRLDKNSHGLVILTNDGDWAEKMTHPRYESCKKYEVEIRKLKGGVSDREVIERFKAGIDIGEGESVARAKLIKQIKDNLFEIILTEGKKRQIRRMFKVLGYDVVDLKRIAVGEIELGNMPDGKWERLRVGNSKK